MELDQEIKLKISPEQSELLIKMSFLTISVITFLASVFFSATTLISINKPKQPVTASQILNIVQINKAVELIAEKTIDFSQTK